jgi:hypothetical protein
MADLEKAVGVERVDNRRAWAVKLAGGSFLATPAWIERNCDPTQWLWDVPAMVFGKEDSVMYFDLKRDAVKAMEMFNG